jgi:hypothetical protein
MPDLADYYREIYARGLGGEAPAIPVAVAELERAALAAMEPRIANYVGAGAGSEETIRANLDAFRRQQILPRMLRDVSARDLSTTVLGTSMPAPLMLAPIGVQQGVHDEGELATARAAAAVGVPMIASTASHFSLEEIAAAGGEAPRWFQLYWPTTPSSPAVSSSEPSGPATKRSSSPSTPSSRAGSRATCSRRGCRSLKAGASATTSRTRSSAPNWSRRRRRTRGWRPANSSPSRPTRR